MVIWLQLLDENDDLKTKVVFSPEKSLSDIDLLNFNQEFPNTFEYTFFFLKALEGFLEIKYDIHKVRLSVKQTITFEIEIIPEKYITITLNDWLRMDLVARLAGRIAEDIKRIQDQVDIVYDINNLKCDDQSVCLDFNTADFVKGIAKKDYGFVKQNHNNSSWEFAGPTDVNSVKYFKIKSKSENEDIELDFNEDIELDFFGWRSAARRSFDDIPISDKSNQKFATYLCFPVFFQYESTNLIFLATKNRCIIDDFEKFYDAGGKDDPRIKHFNDISVQSYVNYKLEYAKNNLKPKYLGSLQTCLGVACHNSVHFEIKEEERELFGVFFQVDIYSENDNINLLQKIYESQLALRPRLRYEILQLLAAESIAQLNSDKKDLEALNKELQKKDQMLSLLIAPLQRLSDALLQTQEDTQELRSILYSPARSLFAAAPNVWQYFESGKKIQVGKLLIETHHNSPSDDQAKQLVAAIILEIMGKRTTVNPSGWRELYGIMDDVLNEKNNEATKELAALCKKILGMNDVSSFANLTGLIKSFKEFKAILFTPYKNFKSNYELIAFNILVDDIKLNNKKWKKNDVKYIFHLPCPQFSHFLEFVSGVIEYASNTGVDTCIVITTSGVQENPTIKSISLKFRTKEIVGQSVNRTIIRNTEQQNKMANFSALESIKKPQASCIFINKVEPSIEGTLENIFTEMKLIIKEGLIHAKNRTAGDLSKPFFDFALACCRRSSKQIEVTINKNKIEIKSEASPKSMIIWLEIIKVAHLEQRAIKSVNFAWE